MINRIKREAVRVSKVYTEVELRIWLEGAYAVVESSDMSISDRIEFDILMIDLPNNLENK